MTIEVVKYDTAWPHRADAACAELRDHLPGLFTSIEHIGSTAVPGLAAKPVIDFMAAAPSLELVTARDETLQLLGYQRHETGMPARLFYLRDKHGRRDCHLHVVTTDSWPTRNEVLIRDYLRAHPAEAQRYAALKAELAAREGASATYTRAKTSLIQELTDRARLARGLPSVPVWEE